MQNIPRPNILSSMKKRARETEEIPLCKRAKEYTVDKTWVTATATRNYALRDPICDWLALTNPPRSNDEMTEFIFAKGVEFEEEIIKVWEERGIDILHMPNRDAYDKSAFEDTLQAMDRGAPVIYNGTLHNPLNETLGRPDILIRSDHINLLTDEPSISYDEERIEAPRFAGKGYHYRVLDIKCSALHLMKNGREVCNSANIPAYKVQVCVYNDALTNVQGYNPETAYLIGKAIRSSNEALNTNKVLTRAGIVNFKTVDKEYINECRNAVEWVKRVRRNALVWMNCAIRPRELYPNMSMTRDSPWHEDKVRIAREIGEITTIWQCSIKHRENAHKLGIMDWRDPRCTSASLGVAKSYAKTIDAILNINRDPTPRIFSADDFSYPDELTGKSLYFIDFETIPSIMTHDVISHENIEQPQYIFMIGVCFRGETGIQCISFIAPTLDYSGEWDMLSRFLKWQEDCRNAVFVHWSSAEPCGWNSLLERHKSKMLALRTTTELPNWFDLMSVFKDTPIAIKGNFAFGLKGVAKALHFHGCIETTWDGEISDGLNASLSTYKRYASKPLITASDLEDVIRYNAIDVKVLCEINDWLLTI